MTRYVKAPQVSLLAAVLAQPAGVPLQPLRTWPLCWGGPLDDAGLRPADNVGPLASVVVVKLRRGALVLCALDDSAEWDERVIGVYILQDGRYCWAEAA